MHATSVAPDAASGRAHGRGRTVPAAVRFVVAAAAFALAFGVVLLFQEYSRRQGELRRLIAAVELDRRQPEAVQRILWDPDVEMGRLQVARALVYEALDPQAFAALPLRDRMTALALVPERLELAREIAGETLRRRPAAWAAAMILGASYYVEWSLRGDARLFTERQTWERPLEVAILIAPGEDEPRRFLALAYLEIWPALPPDERARLLPLLRQALEDRPSFERAVDIWLAVASNRDEAVSLIPDTSWAWQAMAARSAARRDWTAHAEAIARLRAAEAKEFAAALAHLERRRAGGDVRGARAAALGLLAEASPDRRHLALAERALELLPPGPVDEGRARALRAWLEWGLEMALWEQPSLSATALRRLAALLDPLPAPQAALAALLAGDLASAEAVERRHEALNTEPWASYCILKARILARRGETAAAQRILGHVQTLWVGSIPALRSRRAIADAEGNASALAASERALAQLGGEEWPATSWRWRGRVATAGFLAVRAAPGLVVAFDVAPAQGGFVEVSLDGESLPTTPVPPAGEVVIAQPLGAGIHILSVTSPGMGRVVPGRFRLLPP